MHNFNTMFIQKKKYIYKDKDVATHLNEVS